MLLYILTIDLCSLSTLPHMKIECGGSKPIIPNGTAGWQSDSHHSKIMQTHAYIIEKLIKTGFTRN